MHQMKPASSMAHHKEKNPVVRWNKMTSPNSGSGTARSRQPLPIRLMHWINIPLLVIMAGSGLQIFVAYPNLGPRGALYRWYPLQGMAPPSWLRLGGWLAGARHLHFAVAWFLIFNGAVYLLYLLISGEWRRRAFLPLRDAPNAVAMFGYYLRIRKNPPPKDSTMDFSVWLTPRPSCSASCWCCLDWRFTSRFSCTG